jgi:2-polyprenyl-3-methyl-5-hydroxy-6-metoxy-1,4-benzoquinol methylase
MPGLHYNNAGNPELLALIPVGARTVLDVGCGPGVNARLMRARGLEVDGVTISHEEAKIAAAFMRKCLVADLDDGLPAEARENRYDCIVFSHVLEHLRAPEQLVRQSTDLLTDEGVVLIALPNVLNWRQRIAFMRGRFDYADTGVLDRTHLHFYTFHSAPNLIAQADLVLDHLSAPGGVPLWFLRRLAPKWLTAAVDAWGSKTFPGLVGSQILMRARRSKLPKHDPAPG